MARHPWVAEADNGIRWGVQLIVPNRRDALPVLMETGKLADSLGYDAIYIFDHPAIHVDPWIALSGLAVATQRVRLGSAVNCNGYRTPAMIARLSADLDNLSRGRHILGIGSGWWEAEFRGMGLAWETLPRRQAALDEALQIITGAWGEEPFTFSGVHHAVESFQVEPAPFQQPRPPILIGGSGEKRTLGQVARFADACNVRGSESFDDPEVTVSQRAATVRSKFEALYGHLDAMGRPRDEVLRTHFTLYLQLAPTEHEARAKYEAFDASRSTSPGTRRDGKAFVYATTPEGAIAFYQAMANAGAQYFVVQLDGEDHETIRLLAEEVAPHVAMSNEQ